MNHCDYLIVGAGLYGAVFAQQAKKAGKTCLVIDKRPNIAGNVYTVRAEFDNFGGFKPEKFFFEFVHLQECQLLIRLYRFCLQNQILCHFLF